MAFAKEGGGIRSRSLNSTPDGSNHKLIKSMNKKQEKQQILRKLQLSLVSDFLKWYVLITLLKLVILAYFIQKVFLSNMKIPKFDNNMISADKMVIIAKQLNQLDTLHFVSIITVYRIMEFLNFVAACRWSSNISHDVYLHRNKKKQKPEKKYKETPDSDMESQALLSKMRSSSKRDSNRRPKGESQSMKFSTRDTASSYSINSDGRCRGRLSAGSNYSFAMAKATITL